MFAMTACGAADTNASGSLTDEQRTTLLTNVETLTQQIADVSGTDKEAEFAASEVITAGIESWKTSAKEIGEVISVKGESVEENDGTLIARVNVDGSDHDAEVVYSVNQKDGTITNIATNVAYSMGEKLQQAGLNTLLGISTTFVVLILLSLIISCFRFISVFQKKRDERREAKERAASSAEKKQETAPAAVETVSEDLTDDLELVAVIAAAIAASEGRATTDGLVVRSIRRRKRA